MAKRGRILVLGCVLGCGLFAAGCAPGPNEQVGSENQQGVVAGFGRGLWHGAIAPVTFIVSLFTREVRVYEVHNQGGWYDFGFVLGLTVSLGGGGARSARRGKVKPQQGG